MYLFGSGVLVGGAIILAIYRLHIIPAWEKALADARERYFSK
jgi:hypothetical protein